jgi:hypothetical protein
VPRLEHTFYAPSKWRAHPCRAQLPGPHKRRIAGLSASPLMRADVFRGAIGFLTVRTTLEVGLDLRIVRGPAGKNGAGWF